jgi:SAM-dependent methyltransferase
LLVQRAYVANHRDSVIASLAERDALTSKGLLLLDELAAGVPASDRVPALFEDDWTEEEESGDEREAPVADASYRKWIELCASDSPLQYIYAALPETAGQAIEIGPGAGLATEMLAERASSILLVDTSIRSLLTARDKAPSASGVVSDASRLELPEMRADLIVAANVIDVCDEPEELLRRFADWLDVDGTLILTTPRPDLGSDDEELIVSLLKDVGLSVTHSRAALPWVRWHSHRNQQLYWVWAGVATHS